MKEEHFMSHDEVMAKIDEAVEKVAKKLRKEGCVFDLENEASEFVLTMNNREFHFTKVSNGIAGLIS